MSKIHILIVEDEFMIAEDIAMRLSDFGYGVVGQADSASKAVKIMETQAVDLVLVDINIAGETDGIELAAIIRQRFNLPFIFLTSLASKAIVDRALQVGPSAFLLKPFNDRQVQVSIELALRNFENSKPATGVNEPPISEEYCNANLIAIRDSLFLKKDSHFERIRFNEIHYLEAESNYTSIITEHGRFMYSCVLKNFEIRLPKDIFLRVHRSFIVNINKVTGFEGNFLSLGHNRIPVSRKRREGLFELFDVI